MNHAELERAHNELALAHAGHEAGCEVRQNSILDRLGRIEAGILTLLVGAILGLGSIVWFLATNKVTLLVTHAAGT